MVRKASKFDFQILVGDRAFGVGVHDVAETSTAVEDLSWVEIGPLNAPLSSHSRQHIGTFFLRPSQGWPSIAATFRLAPRDLRSHRQWNIIHPNIMLGISGYLMGRGILNVEYSFMKNAIWWIQGQPETSTPCASFEWVRPFTRLTRLKPRKR